MGKAKLPSQRRNATPQNQGAIQSNQAQGARGLALKPLRPPVFQSVKPRLGQFSVWRLGNPVINCPARTAYFTRKGGNSPSGFNQILDCVHFFHFSL